MADVAKSSKGGKTTRLMITKMVLENFKSYAGVQNIGPFHKRFSSVVGPNGSGKSNVIDALLFVFGKRAKQLRLNKVSELIHKSSAFPNLEYANVEVHFQLIVDDDNDEDAYEVVPGSQFEVSRTAFQNNTSKYCIGSKTSNFNDVGTLLRSHGIDLDNNRFLILQGEVEQIAMMKPKGTAGPVGANGTSSGGEDGLLEYLEDIIGSNKYVEQIEQWAKTLDELNERRIEKVNRMKIAERDRDNLSGSRQEAEEFLEKERDIRRKQNLLYQLIIFEAVNMIEEASQKRTVVAEKLTAEKKKRAENDRQLVESEKEYEVTRAKYDRICEELSKATADFSAYERRDIKITEDRKHTTAQIKKLEATIAKEAKKDTDSGRDVERAEKEMAALHAKVAALEAEKAAEEAKLQEIMDSLQEATTSIRATVEAKQIELGKAQSVVSAIQTEKETTCTALSLVTKRVETNKAQFEVCNNRTYQIQNELKEKLAQATAITEKKAATTARIATVEGALAKNIATEATLNEQLQGAIMQCEEGKLLMQNSKAGHSSIVESVLKASKKGGPLAAAGVRGRLGDLATIAPEYDVAISTACGMLDHLVVETVEGGQAVLQYIRDHKLGRMSLIVLNQMDAHKRNMDRPFTVPSGANRLFDLINISSPDLRPAFFCAMANTLVTNTLDSAVKLAYVGDKVVHRIVALDGNLIDTSGAMSGGGKTSRSGAMRLSSASAAGKKSAASEEEITPQRLAQLEAAVKVLQAALSTLRQERTALEKELKECKATIKQLDMDAAKSKMMVARLQEQEVENTEKIAACSSGMTLDAAEEAEVNKLQAKVAELDAKISLTSPNLATLTAEVAALQQQIMDIGGPKLKRTQLFISECSAKLDEATAALSSKEVEINNCKKLGGQASKLVQKTQNELAKQQEKLAALAQEQKEMEEDALQLMDALKSADKLKAQQEQALKATKIAYDELNEAVSALKTAEVDLQTQCETYAAVIKENTSIKTHWEKALKVVRSKHMEEKSEMRSLLKSFQLTGAKKNMEIIAPSSSAAATEAGSASKMDMEEASSDAEGEADDAADDSDIALLTRDQIAERFGGTEEDATVTPAMLKKISSARDETKHDISVLEMERDKLKSNVNMGALMEYLRKDADYRLRLVDLEGITVERNAARKSYEECRRKRLEEFMSGFGVITLKLKEMYQMITLGGDAELELVDSLDPFAEGIVFSVRPPKKSWKNISNLSGGEKTLSSLALVFALHHYKPTPLYVMDEIDAALDFKNVSIVANYIKERTKNAQFIIISLRNNMFELADRLVGIYKTYDCTKSVTINPKLFNNCGDVEVNDGGANNTGNVNDFLGKAAGKAAATAGAPAVLANSTNTRA